MQRYYINCRSVKNKRQKKLNIHVEMGGESLHKYLFIA